MGGNWHFRLTHNKAGVVSDIHHNNLKQVDGSAVTTDDDFKQWLKLEEFSNGQNIVVRVRTNQHGKIY